MNAQLVKIDVAAAALGWSAAKLFDLVDGGTLLERGFAWVFNLANDPSGERRDLRFWFPEIQARADAATSKHGKFSYYEISWVVAKILPEKRRNFHAGEVDQLFQIRPRTRIDLHAELFFAERGLSQSAAASHASAPRVGTTRGPNFYPRAALAAFLTRRWLGAVYSRTANFPAATPAFGRAAAALAADTNKATRARQSSPTATNRVPSSPAAAESRPLIKQKRNGFNLTAPASLSGADNFATK